MKLHPFVCPNTTTLLTCNSCGYNIVLIPHDLYREMVNHPCTKCQSVMFTQADCDALQQIDRKIARVNRYLSWLTVILRNPDQRLWLANRYLKIPSEDDDG